MTKIDFMCSDGLPAAHSDDFQVGPNIDLQKIVLRHVAPSDLLHRSEVPETRGIKGTSLNGTALSSTYGSIFCFSPL
jgi:hypothetical protein